MLPSGINTPLERGKCKSQIQEQASAGNTSLPILSGTALPPCACPVTLELTPPAPAHLFLACCCVSALGFPICTALAAPAISFFSRHCTGSWSCKMRLCPCLSSSWQEPLPDTSGDEPLLPLLHCLSRNKTPKQPKGTY